LIEYQINNHQLQEKIREIERENLKAKDNLEQEQKLRSAAEIDNVRQRQQIDDLKQEILHIETKSKSMLY
jgi:molecular chaperone GrpE (heat shock protein)